MKLKPSPSLSVVKLVLQCAWRMAEMHRSMQATAVHFLNAGIRPEQRLTFSQGSHILVDLRRDRVFARRKLSVRLEVRNLRALHPFMLAHCPQRSDAFAIISHQTAQHRFTALLHADSLVEELRSHIHTMAGCSPGLMFKVTCCQSVLK